MPAVSKKQRKFMGIVRGIQSGDLDPKDYSKAAQTAAKKMDPSDVKKYASTKDKGLPLRKESAMRLAEVVRDIINSRK